MTAEVIGLYDGAGKPARGGRGASATQILQRYDRGRRIWECYKPLWSDCYRLALPGRRGFDEESPGQNRMADIYDETAVVTAPEAASKVLEALMPTYQRWASLKAGRTVPAGDRERVDKQLDEVNESIFEDINNSALYDEAHDAMLECMIGTGALEIMPGTALEPLRVQAYPLTDIVIECGPFNRPDGVFVRRMVAAGMAKIEFPLAKFSEEFQRLVRTAPLKPVEFIVATYRDWSRIDTEVTKRCVIWKEKKELVQEQTWEGIGSNPMIVFRWHKSAGEAWGRGPLLNCLPAVKTLNLTVQLILENAELAITGMWQAESNSVTNPANIQLIPGTILPIQPGSSGLQPLETPGRFDVAELVLDKMQSNVKRALYADQFAPLDKTPMSATEAALRQQDMAQRIGSSFGRLQRELVVPIIRRVAWIQRSQGRIELPVVNGRLIRIDPISPLARAQRNEDIMAIERLGSQLVNIYGPQATMIVMDPVETAKELADLGGVPKRIIRNKAAMKAIIAQTLEAAQKMQEAA